MIYLRTALPEVLPVVKSGRVRSADAELQRSYRTVKLPSETIGECIKSSSCKQFSVHLADGLCVDHWDKHVTYKDGYL